MAKRQLDKVTSEYEPESYRFLEAIRNALMSASQNSIDGLRDMLGQTGITANETFPDDLVNPEVVNILDRLIHNMERLRLAKEAEASKVDLNLTSRASKRGSSDNPLFQPGEMLPSIDLRTLEREIARMEAILTLIRKKFSEFSQNSLTA